MRLRSLLQRMNKEPIHLLAKRHNYFPKRFIWRGEQYDVYAVERVWTEVKRRGAWHCFRIRCEAGTLDLVQDTNLNAWYLTAETG